MVPKIIGQSTDYKRSLWRVIGKTETIPQNKQVSKPRRSTHSRPCKAPTRHPLPEEGLLAANPRRRPFVRIERHRGEWVLVGRRDVGRQSERGLSNVDETASYFLMLFSSLPSWTRGFLPNSRRIYESCWVWWNFWVYFVVRERHSSVSRRWVWQGLMFHVLRLH